MLGQQEATAMLLSHSHPRVGDRSPGPGGSRMEGRLLHVTAGKAVVAFWTFTVPWRGWTRCREPRRKGSEAESAAFQNFRGEGRGPAQGRVPGT